MRKSSPYFHLPSPPVPHPVAHTQAGTPYTIFEKKNACKKFDMNFLASLYYLSFVIFLGVDWESYSLQSSRETLKCARRKNLEALTNV